VPGTGGFTGVMIQSGSQVFPPGDTTVSGNFCYNFPANVNSMRVEFKIDSADGSCSPHLKSTSIPPCTHTGGCSLDFSDVQPNDTFYAGVSFLHSAGVVSGYADGTLRPYNSVTRAQVA